MRILFVNRLMGVFWGGGESFDYNITRALRAEGESVAILTGCPLFSPLGQESGSKPDAVPLHRVRTPYLRWIHYRLSGKLPKVPMAALLADLAFFEARAFSWIRERRSEFDVVELLALPRLGRRIVGELGIPVVIRYPGPPSSRWDAPVLRELARTRRTRFFAAGDALRVASDQGLPFENIPQGVDAERFVRKSSRLREELGFGLADRILLSVGRQVPGKGFEFLLEGFARAAAKRADLRLLVAGDGVLLPALKKRAEQLGLAERVRFAGRIEHERLPDYYGAADLFLLLSEYENFSNTVLEAMACGLPVVATDVGGFPLQVREGVNGHLVPSGDLAALEAAILKLAGDADARERMGSANREKVVTEFSWSASAKKLSRIYRELAAEPN